ncbi:MAG: FAD-binding oxidoreductase [Solirubrobacteraceae bacterium]
MSGSAALRAALARALGGERVICPVPEASLYNADAAGDWRRLRGRADAVALPESAEEVATLVRFCVERGLPLVPRGGGTGVSGGACPTEGGIVCALERMRGVDELEPGEWRMRVGAGTSTADVRRLARENGLLFAPDPGAAEQSQIGGNVATDAGGPHALKYGSTRHWVTGVEAVVPPGEIVRLGGRVRKDVAGYDAKDLLAGSEGTLGVVTSVDLRLIPAPEAAIGLVVFADGLQSGCAAVEAALGSGALPAALELIDGMALAQVGSAYGRELPPGAGSVLMIECDGSAAEVESARGELFGALSEGSLRIDVHEDLAAMWRWREGVSGAVAAVHGGKVSEDVAVPPQRLAELLEGFAEEAAAERLDCCAFGHAGDGNMHATLMLDPYDEDAMARAERVSGRLFELTVSLGGSISGEHGLGVVKRDALALQYDEASLALQRRLKEALDPTDTMNPGKKLPPA